jgi:hypothetical protein
MTLRSARLRSITLYSLGLALFLAGTATAAVDPVLLNLVMPDAKFLTGIQVDQSVASPFGQYILSQMQPTDTGFQKFVAATGFNPTRDLQQILAATGTTTPSHDNVLLLGRGTFQPSQISTAALAAGGTVTQYKGIAILTGPEQHSHGSLAFLDSTTVALGDVAVVQAAIDRRIAGPAFTGALATAAQTVSATNQAWFATVTPLSDFLNGKLNGNLGDVSQGNLLQSVTAASGGVIFGSTAITLTADAVTASNQNAQALVDVLKFLASMIQTNVIQTNGNAPVATSLLDTATFLANGPVAHLSLIVPEQQAEQLFMQGGASKPKAKKPLPAPAQ